MPKLHIETNINGDPVEYLCEPSMMLSVLRETRGMTGTKEGWTGDCGACSIQVDGRLVCSCLMLAAESKIPRSKRSKEYQVGMVACSSDKFLEHAALQCGIVPWFYCCFESFVRKILTLTRR